MTVLVALPAVYLVIRASGAGWDTVEASLLRARTADLAVNTVQLAVAVTAASVILGVAMAVCVCRGIRRGRTLAVALLAAPLAVPSYVSGFAWGRMFSGFEGFPAAVLVLIMACYPLVMLPAIAVLSAAGRSAEDVARTLGYGPLRTFLWATAPRLRTAVAGGALLVALYTVSDFGGPAIVRYEVFTVGIYNAYNGSVDRSLAAVYGCVLVVIALVLALSERLARGDHDEIGAPERRPASSESPVAWLCVTATVTVGLFAPIWSLISAIRTSQRVPMSSVADVKDLLVWVWPLARNTFEIAMIAAAVIVVVSVPLALFIRRPRTPLSGAVEVTLNLGFALPGIAVALALVFFGIRVLPELYLTTTMLTAAYLILFLPVCLGPLRGAFDAIAPGQEDSARTLGAGYLATIARVSLPTVTPALVAGAALACLSVAKELPATLMLAPIGTRTLATDLWSLNNDLRYGQAAVLGLALIVVTSIPTVLLSTRFLPRGE